MRVCVCARAHVSVHAVIAFSIFRLVLGDLSHPELCKSGKNVTVRRHSFFSIRQLFLRQIPFKQESIFINIVLDRKVVSLDCNLAPVK